MMLAPLKWDKSKKITNKTNIFERTTHRKIYRHVSVTGIAKSIPLQIRERHPIQQYLMFICNMLFSLTQIHITTTLQYVCVIVDLWLRQSLYL